MPMPTAIPAHVFTFSTSLTFGTSLYAQSHRVQTSGVHVLNTSSHLSIQVWCVKWVQYRWSNARQRQVANASHASTRKKSPMPVCLATQSFVSEAPSASV